jgi:hypothetical protein
MKCVFLRYAHLLLYATFVILIIVMKQKNS